MNTRRSFVLALVLVAYVAGGFGGDSSAAAPPSAPIQEACAPTTGVPTGTAASLLAILTNAKSAYRLNAIIFDATVRSTPLLITAIGDSTPGVPASTAMHFRVGMSAEQFETTILLQLVDQHRINLSDSASKWFPDYPFADLATVRMLAASSAGFGDYVYGPANPALGIVAFGDLLDQHLYRKWTPNELIRRSESPYQTPQFDDPGGNWQYSHTGFVMLGSILQKVTGQKYSTLLRRMILNKLRLHNTVYPSTPKIQAPVLHAFTSERGTYEDSTFWSPSWTSFSGNVNSDVCDLAAWEEGFGTGALLTPASEAQITAATNVGLGLNTAHPLFRTWNHCE